MEAANAAVAETYACCGYPARPRVENDGHKVDGFILKKNVCVVKKGRMYLKSDNLQAHSA
jgi:hypothetical protein